LRLELNCSFLMHLIDRFDIYKTCTLRTFDSERDKAARPEEKGQRIKASEKS